MYKKAKKQNHNRGLDLNIAPIDAMNDNQKKVLKSNTNLVLTGFAGTGKSFLAIYLALRALCFREVERIVIIRSTAVTRDIGALPGDLNEKVDPFELPYKDIVTELLGRGDAYEILKKQGSLVFMPTTFIRGISLHNCVVIVDEFQNMNYHELDSVITRSGINCRYIFSGDIHQSDIRDSGFAKFFKVLQDIDCFDFVNFGKEDIVRGPLVKSYIIAKDKYEQSHIK